MNREEIISNLLYMKRSVKEDTIEDMTINEAIKALEQELCEDCISRQAVLEKAICVPIARVVTEDKVIYRKIVFVDEIENIPPVTPAEKVGQWIARGLVDSNGNRIYECSECHHSDTQAATIIVPYCWYCGSRMMQEVEE